MAINHKGDVKTFIVVVGTLGSFTTIFVGSFTLQCIKCNGAKFINKIVVNPHKRAWNEANCCSVLRLGEGGGRSVQCTFSARPGKCQKSYTNKIVRNQFGVKFPLSTVVKTHTDSNIPIVITSPLWQFLKSYFLVWWLFGLFFCSLQKAFFGSRILIFETLSK